MQEISPHFFKLDAKRVAKGLIGKLLIQKRNPQDSSTWRIGRIIETEAYFGKEDQASHACNKPNLAKPMYLEGGHLYVYLIYGLYYMLNIITGPKGKAEAVLIRQLLPLRNLQDTSGPAKLSKALEINFQYNSRYLFETNLTVAEDCFIPKKILSAPRVGVDYAGEWAKKKLRFCLHFDLDSRPVQTK